MTKNRYGEGFAYYVGTCLEKEQLKKYVLLAAADAGVEVPEERWPVIIKNGTVNDRKLHYFLHYSETYRETVCPYEKATELFSGKIYQKGENIPLKDWDVKILEEKERE